MMRSIDPQPDEASRPDRSTRHGELQVVAAAVVFVVLLAAAVFLALIGSPQVLLIIVFLCTAVALVEVAAIISTRIRH
jgi:hypothetical protein